MFVHERAPDVIESEGESVCVCAVCCVGVRLAEKQKSIIELTEASLEGIVHIISLMVSFCAIFCMLLLVSLSLTLSACVTATVTVNVCGWWKKNVFGFFFVFV